MLILNLRSDMLQTLLIRMNITLILNKSKYLWLIERFRKYSLDLNTLHDFVLYKLLKKNADNKITITKYHLVSH